MLQGGLHSDLLIAHEAGQLAEVLLEVIVKEAVFDSNVGQQRKKVSRVAYLLKS